MANTGRFSGTSMARILSRNIRQLNQKRDSNLEAREFFYTGYPSSLSSTSSLYLDNAPITVIPSTENIRCRYIMTSVLGNAASTDTQIGCALYRLTKEGTSDTPNVNISWERIRTLKPSPTVTVTNAAYVPLVFDLGDELLMHGSDIYAVLFYDRTAGSNNIGLVCVTSGIDQHFTLTAHASLAAITESPAALSALDVGAQGTATAFVMLCSERMYKILPRPTISHYP